MNVCREVLYPQYSHYFFPPSFPIYYTRNTVPTCLFPNKSLNHHDTTGHKQPTLTTPIITCHPTHFSDRTYINTPTSPSNPPSLPVPTPNPSHSQPSRTYSKTHAQCAKPRSSRASNVRLDESSTRVSVEVDGTSGFIKHLPQQTISKI